MSTALYRRYRPETFAEVIGQDHVTGPLMQALRTGRVTHAYLFSGPRGCGKTTSARILARTLNCVRNTPETPIDTPCGECPSCVELARGGSGSLDVVEIDAASHNGVDDARDLRERAAFAPARDRYKIFILDEAHMVTAQGFNALLKIVEEPPPHVKFIFATTEPDKVIGTIRSRTHHYPFRLVPPDVLGPYLEQLCAAEGVTIGSGVVPLVTRAGGGSVRDSLSVMDQLMAGADDGQVDYERAVALLGFTHATLLDDVVDALAARDGASIFRVVEQIIATGHEPRRFVEDVLERLRDLIVIGVSGDAADAVLRDVPSDQLDRMKAQAGNLGVAELSRAADLVNTALTEMSGATSPRLHLELLMARLLLPGADDGAAGFAARLDRLERGGLAAGVVAAAAPAAESTPLGRVDRPGAATAADQPLRAAPASGLSGAAAARAALQASKASRGAVTPEQGVPAPGTTASSPGTGGQAQGSATAPWAVAVPSTRVDDAADLAPVATSTSGDGPDGSTALPAEAERPAHEVQPAAAAARPAADEAPPAPAPASEGARAGGAAARGGAHPDGAAGTGGTVVGGTAGAGGTAAGGTAGAPPDDPSEDWPAVAVPAGEPGPEHGAPSAPTPDGGVDTGVSSVASVDGPSSTVPAPTGITTEELRRRWPEVLQTLSAHRVTWSLVSANAQVGELTADVLYLAFQTPALARTFSTSRHIGAVQDAVYQTLGVQVRVEARLDEGGHSAPGGAPAGAPHTAPSGPVAGQAGPVAGQAGPAAGQAGPAAPGSTSGSAPSPTRPGAQDAERWGAAPERTAAEGTGAPAGSAGPAAPTSSAHLAPSGGPAARPFAATSSGPAASRGPATAPHTDGYGGTGGSDISPVGGPVGGRSAARGATALVEPPVVDAADEAWLAGVPLSEPPADLEDGPEPPPVLERAPDGHPGRTGAGAPGPSTARTPTARPAPSGAATTGPDRAPSGTGARESRRQTAERQAAEHRARQARAAAPVPVDDDMPSDDDPDLASAGLVGAPLVATLLGGVVIDEIIDQGI